MITGFNTDVSYQGVTYHVQTEDKGLQTPLILTLVFDRGTILAAKRSPYDDLVEGRLDEKVLEERLHRQHKLVCAAIRAGRLEDLKKLSVKRGVPAAEARSKVDLGKSIPMPESPPVWDIPLVDEVSVVDEPDPASEEKVEAVRVSGGGISVVDEISAYENVSDHQLKVKIVGGDKFISGDRKSVNVLVCRGGEDSSVGGASVMIKILGSDFRPLIYHAKADVNGIAAVMVKIPAFRTGRAALLVRAMTGGEEAEYRHVITHKR